MGFILSEQEIINTPEAKGARLQPSSRGRSISISRLPIQHDPSLIPPRPWRAGWFEEATDHARRKSEARESAETARSLQLMQQDSQPDKTLGPAPSLRLSKNFAGLDELNTSPSNCSIAAGPFHLMVSVNSTLAIFEKTGRQIIHRALNDLFADLTGAVIISCPKVLYDQFQNRWIIGACARSIEGQNSRFLLAYSQTTDPLGDWWTWSLDACLEGSFKSNHLADAIGISIDHNSLYLTANIFSGQGLFLYSKLRVLNRKELQTGGILHGWEFWDLRNVDGTPVFGLQPAINLRAAGVQFLLNATNDGQGLTLWSYMEPPRQNPVLSRRFLPTVSFQLAPNSKQLGTRILIETGDTRLGPVIFRHGMLWAVHTVAANWGDDENVAAIQWFQINPRAGCIIHQGIYGAPHANYFSPAVMVDGEGNLAIVFNRCGTWESSSIRFTGRRPSDEANKLHPSLLLQCGTKTESPEWMAFSSGSIAPEDSMVWITGQYAATEYDWSTWIGAVTFMEIEESRNKFFDPSRQDFLTKLTV